MNARNDTLCTHRAHPPGVADSTSPEGCPYTTTRYKIFTQVRLQWCSTAREGAGFTSLRKRVDGECSANKRSANNGAFILHVLYVHAD